MQKSSQHELALELLQRGNPEQAISLFERALQDRESSELWSDWAVAKATAGEIEAASKGFQRALALDPNNRDAASNLKLLVDPVETAGIQPMDRGEQHHQHARECFRQGKLPDAAWWICRALEYKETSIRWNDYGTVALALASLEEAERGYRRAVELDKTNALAATNLIILLRRLKRTEEADQYLSLTSDALLAEQEKEVEHVFVRYAQEHTD